MIHSLLSSAHLIKNERESRTHTEENPDDPEPEHGDIQMEYTPD
jgi:hypothetical protein